MASFRRAPAYVATASLLALAGALSSCGGGGSSSANGSGTDSGGSTAPLTLSGEQSSVKAFYTGHSLLDDPIADDVASIAASLSKQIQWNEQIVLGSPIRARTRGDGYTDPSFPGYHEGKNRSTSNLDVVSELRQPTTISGHYDTLVIAERYDLAQTLQYEDTVRYARHFHERLIEGNTGSTSYLYHAWLSIKSIGDPSSWIAYERAAAPIWRCTAARINVSLAAEGRSDRMHYLPAGLAMAELIDKAVQGQVDGISGGTATDVVRRLIVDDVHPTALGAYFVALVTYSTLYRASPVGAWGPDGVSQTQKQSLQALAWSVVTTQLAGASDPDLASCRSAMVTNYCATFNNYMGSASNTAGCQSYFSASGSANPFVYDAAGDAGYWFPAPQ